MAVPPSLSVSVGVPPATVTASLRFSVSVTVLPALRSPLAVTPTSDAMVGVVVSICGPLWVRPESERLAALPAPSVMVAELRLTAVAASDAVFCPGGDGVAEGQRIAAGAAGIGGGAAVVERERRRAARDRHGFAQVEREGDGVAGVEVAAARRLGQRRDGRCCGVDLRAALGEAGEREVGGIAGAVGDGCGVEIDGGGGERGGVLSGGHGVAEGERIGAGAAGIGGGAAVVERERRRAAGNRHRLAQVEREA